MSSIFTSFAGWLSVPKNYMLFSMALNSFMVNWFSSGVDELTEEEKDAMIEEYQISIDSKMEEMRKK